MQDPHSTLSSGPPTDGANHRRSERIALERPARLVFVDLSRAIDVTLKDVSWEGVRLTSPEGVMLPRDVYIMVPDPADSGLLRLACETRWQVGATAGLRFVDAAEKSAIAALIASARPSDSSLTRIFQDLSGR